MMRAARRSSTENRNVIGTWDPGHGRQQVVGEGHHKHELSRLANHYGGGLTGEARVVAVLVPEPTNPYDRNAVAVVIDEQLVGYIPSEDTAAYSVVLGPLAAAGTYLGVPARLWWGDDGEFYASVTLHLPAASLLFAVNAIPAGHVLLPAVWKAKLSGTDAHVDVLAPYLAGRTEALIFVTLTKVTQTTARTSKDVVQAQLDGRPIGQLTPTTCAALMPVIDHATRAGKGVAAFAVARGNQLQVSVDVRAQKAADLPSDWLAANFPPMAAQPAPTTPPASWYPDPTNPTQWRYWDGAAWTDHTNRAMNP